MDALIQSRSGLIFLQAISYFLIGLSGLIGFKLLSRRTDFLHARWMQLDTLRERPLEPFQASSVLGIVLLFAIPVALTPETTTIAPPSSMIILALNCIAYALFGLSTCAIVLSIRRTSFQDAFLHSPTPWPVACKKGVVYGLAAIAPTLLLSYGCTEGLDWLGFDTSSQDVFAWLDDADLPLLGKLMICTTAVVFAPLTEELMFRGILLPCALKPRRSFWFSTLLVGVLFAIVHFHPASFLPLILLSCFFSAGYAQTGSILTPITMHAIFNATSLLFFYADFE